MTDAYYDNVVKTKDLFGTSAFICKTCRKVVTKVQKGLKDMETRMKAYKKENETLRLEVGNLKVKVNQLEGGGDKAGGNWFGESQRGSER